METNLHQVFSGNPSHTDSYDFRFGGYSYGRNQLQGNQMYPQSVQAGGYPYSYCSTRFEDYTNGYQQQFHQTYSGYHMEFQQIYPHYTFQSSNSTPLLNFGIVGAGPYGSTTMGSFSNDELPFVSGTMMVETNYGSEHVHPSMPIEHHLRHMSPSINYNEAASSVISMAVENSSFTVIEAQHHQSFLASTIGVEHDPFYPDEQQFYRATVIDVPFQIGLSNGEVILTNERASVFFACKLSDAVIPEADRLGREEIEYEHNMFDEMPRREFSSKWEESKKNMDLKLNEEFLRLEKKFETLSLDVSRHEITVGIDGKAEVDKPDENRAIYKVIEYGNKASNEKLPSCPHEQQLCYDTAIVVSFQIDLLSSEVTPTNERVSCVSAAAGNFSNVVILEAGLMEEEEEDAKGQIKVPSSTSPINDDVHEVFEELIPYSELQLEIMESP